jgi:plasmid stabilization system protein ParE
VTTVAFSDEARDDLRDARAFYAAIAEGLADRFAAEVERAVRLIGEHPSAWTSMGHGLRRVVMHRFPYVLVYREGAAQHRVIAVAHTRRARYWRGRR